MQNETHDTNDCSKIVVSTESNEQILDVAILKVVMWWADKSFGAPFIQNNGDQSPVSGMVNTLGNRALDKARESLTQQKVSAFMDKLTELLHGKDLPWQRKLSVDYDPCDLLEEAATYAGIDTHCFPWKSYTYIDEGNRAFAKYQYGGPTIKL